MNAQDDDRAVYVPVEPADPFTEAIRTRTKSARRSCSPNPIPASGRICPTPIPTPTRSATSASSKYIEAYRVYPQARTEEIAAHAGGMAWKLQGADPLARVLVVVSLNLLDPVLDAMEKPQAAARSRRRREDRAAAQSASRLPGRDHRRISVSAGALRNVPAWR